MRISFDLDDTLIIYREDVPCEPRLAWWKRLLIDDEPLRAGAVTLMRQLQQRGHEVWIYTTSYRSPLAVRWWLLAHGVRVGRVINQNVHDTHLRRGPDDYPPSKNPRAFGIHLHIDDSDGVREEGARWGFSVVVVEPTDPEWATKVLAAVGG